MRIFRVIIASAATLSVAAASACISERTEGPTQTAEACTANLPTTAFGTTIVIIRNFAFSPATVNVARGSKVTWVNCGATGDDAHTSSADAGQWNSQLLGPGDTYTQEFTAAGSFPYHCDPHPFMHGTVTVQ
jgi:plastocyanin